MEKMGVRVGIQILVLMLLTGCGCGRAEQSNVPNAGNVGIESAENIENYIQTPEEERPEEERPEEETPEEQIPEEDVESDDDGGGNEFSAQEQEAAEGNCISVLVSENKYYYNNSVVELEDIVVLINEAGEGVYLEIRDDEATHREYSALIDRMEELEVPYVEV